MTSKTLYKRTLIMAGWLVTTILLLFTVEDSNTSMWITIAGIAFGLLHVILSSMKTRSANWAARFEDYHVIDRGQGGRKFRLPEHLQGHYEIVSAVNVEARAREIEQQLKTAENEEYLAGRLKVHRHYFRFGERCNEYHKDYRAHLIQTIDENREKLHTKLAAGQMTDNGKTFNLREGWYRKRYLENGLNGSEI